MTRFVVRTVTGYSEGARSSKTEPHTSYMVLDSHYNYREVRSTSNGPRDFTRRLLAQEAADALEAEYGE